MKIIQVNSQEHSLRLLPLLNPLQTQKASFRINKPAGKRRELPGVHHTCEEKRGGKEVLLRLPEISAHGDPGEEARARAWRWIVWISDEADETFVAKAVPHPHHLPRPHRPPPPHLLPLPAQVLPSGTIKEVQLAEQSTSCVCSWW